MTFRQIFLFFSSLKLAVISILGLAAVLAVGTVLESWYGMRAAHMMVYGTWWFGGVLFILGLNVLCAALSRYPWKRHQIGFLITHSGILILLLGSFLTQKFGVDGNLPIEEKKSSNSVLLNDLKLIVTDEESGESKIFPVPESGTARSGDLMRVHLFGDYSLYIDQFYPRSRVQTQREASPVAGLGVPSVEVELASSRFKVRETLESRSPQSATEFNLGPAVLSFQKLWSAEDENRFLQSQEEKPALSGKGMLSVFLKGREYRLDIDELLSGWQPLGDSGHSIHAHKYFTHAVVENNSLVNKSNEPVNPAIEIDVRSVHGVTENHTLFANFPEFPTLHRKTAPAQTLGLTFALNLSQGTPEREEIGIVGKKRGRLQIAQSANNEKLFYKVFGAGGKINSRGELKINEPVATGWMDAKVTVVDWKPSSALKANPRNVDKITNAEANLPSAIHYFIGNKDRQPASDLSESGWISLGETRRIVLKNHRLLVELGKETLKLPFELKLEKFRVGRDPGTDKAASYESTVVPIGPNKLPPTLISMNEPLHYEGYTFYQASYQERPGRPTISIFSVNWDPGRWVKYLGSLLICLGIIVMFYMNPHYFGILLGKKQP